MLIVRSLRTKFGIAGVIVAGLALYVPGALASGNANWGNGVKATLPAGGTQAVVNSVSCGSPGNCTAVGFYTDGSGHNQGLLLTGSAGAWSQGIQVTLPSGANANPNVSLNSVSCASVGNCTAVGNYTDNVGGGHTQGLLVTESGGAWAQGVKATPAATATDPFVTLGSVSCGAAASCVAVGSYFDGSNKLQGVLVTETPGSPPSVTETAPAPVPAGANATPQVGLSSVSCASAGNCTAAGDYTDGSGNGQGLLLTLAAGSWTAHEAGLPADAASAAGVDLTSVSCGSAGNCTAVGKYFNAAGHQGVMLTETSGTWATGAKATLPGDAASNPNVRIDAVSCASAGNCSAVGTYTDGAHDDGLLLNQTAGSWGAGVKASPPPGAGTAGSAPNASFSSISCPSAGNCAAVGTYYDGPLHTQGLLMTESAGTWATGVEATLPAGAATDPQALLTSVSCPSAGSCTLGGRYAEAATVQGVMITAAPVSPSLSLSAPATGTAGTPIAAASVIGTLSAGAAPIGAITFTVFGPQSVAPSSCGSGGTAVGGAAASGNGAYSPSAGFTPPSAGDYWWYASYGGDPGNNAAASTCGGGMAETVVAPGGSGGGGTGGGGTGGGGGGTGGGPGGTGSVRVGQVKVSGSTATVALACTGAATARCNVTLTLTATETLRGTKVLAVSASATHRRLVRKVVTLGTVRVTLSGGQHKSVRVSLNAAGRRLLAKLHHFTAKLTVAQDAKVIARKTVTFRAPKRKRR